METTAPSPPAEPVDRRSTGPLPPWVHRLDERIDAAVQRWRRPAFDPFFYTLSSAADHSLLWFAVGSMRSAVAGDPQFMVRFGAVMGAESALTNGPIKLLFRRVRPTDERTGPLPYGMRRPITSSFPSGHATAAFTAAMMLTTSKKSALVWFPLAGLVATSRVYVRMHHASDIVVGAGLGLVFGAAGRRILRGAPRGRARGRRV